MYVGGNRLWVPLSNYEVAHSKQYLLLGNILDHAKLSGDSYMRKSTANHTRPVFENQ